MITVYFKRQFMKKYIILICMIIISGIIQAGTIDPLNNDISYIDFGSKCPNVARVCGEYNDGTKYCASGIIIASNWTLTAAHVVENAKNCTVIINEKKFTIVKIKSHKDFQHDKFGFYDIALLKNNDSFNLSEYPVLYKDSDEVGKECVVSGYGLTGTFKTGCVLSDNKKRAGLNKIAYIDRHLLICTTDDDNTSLEFLIASGDSGGPLFINKKLAGINSCVLAADKKPDSNYGDESGHTRISEHIKWIEETINEK